MEMSLACSSFANTRPITKLRSLAIFLVVFVLCSTLTSTEAYDALDPNGNITIKWDIMQWTTDGYVALVMIYNYQQYRHIQAPGWTLGWTWAKKEVIWSMVGAQTTEQGDCSKFKENIPHCCKKDPTVVDLLPATPYGMQIANCCKGGVMSSLVQDPANAASSFQLSVGLAGTSAKTAKAPQNFTFIVPGPGYTCGNTETVEPSKFVSTDGRRKNPLCFLFPAGGTHRKRVMASGAVEKTADELRKEIQELQRQQREITERLRDPRGLRRAGLAPNGPRLTGGPRQRGVVRPVVESEDQPAPKRRLLSAVVKVDGGETKEEESGANDANEKDPAVEVGTASGGENSKPRAANSQSNGAFRSDGNTRLRGMDFDIPTEPVPRNLPKDEDPRLVKRNKRMLGQLLGTLEKFREEDKQLSATEAYMRRSDSLRRAEQKAREESERLRQQEREQIAEKRRRDLTLRARVAAKAEEKKLELLFLLWAEHHKKLSNFLRTKAEPPIYYMPAKPLVEDTAIVEQRKEQVFLEWKSARRAELSEFQKQIEEQHISNVEKELERWQNARNARRANNLVNLQETMDKELETHKLEHGPKTRRIPGSNDDEEDVEDIAADDELMDEVLEVHERIDGDAAKLSETGNGSPSPVEMH